MSAPLGLAAEGAVTGKNTKKTIVNPGLIIMMGPQSTVAYRAIPCAQPKKGDCPRDTLKQITHKLLSAPGELCLNQNIASAESRF